MRGEFFLFLTKLLNEGEITKQSNKFLKEIFIEKEIHLNGLCQGTAKLEI